MKIYKFIDLFAGIGGIRLGFEQAGAQCVFSSEWDKFAEQTYQANFNEIPKGDITKIDAANIDPFDILCAGFPCQPFSNAGHKNGFEDTRGTLFFDILRIVDHHKPKVIFLENVKGLLSHDGGFTFYVTVMQLFDRGYRVHSGRLNSKDFGLPQNRERVYIVAFRDNAGEDFKFPNTVSCSTLVSDILDTVVDSKYTLSDKLWAGHVRRKEEHKRRGNGFGYSLFNNNSKYTNTLSARYGKDGSEILIAQEGKNPRKLTPRECARLQGFPDRFIIPVSDCQAYKQFGNSVSIPVIYEIANEIMKSLDS